MGATDRRVDHHVFGVAVVGQVFQSAICDLSDSLAIIASKNSVFCFSRCSRTPTTLNPKTTPSGPRANLKRTLSLTMPK
jgi:hypothetical protein